MKTIFSDASIAHSPDSIRRKSLSKIAGAMNLERRSALPGGPAAGKACFWSLWLAVLSFYLVSSERIHPAMSLQLSVVAIVFALTYYLTVRLAPYRTYSALIYDLLAQYDPKDIPAYRRLQADAAEHGLYGRDSLQTWLQQERIAVAEPETIPIEKERFIHRKVGEPNRTGAPQQTTSEMAQYRVVRGGVSSDRLASSTEVGEFLDSCGIPKGSQDWHAALSGVPIQVDGTTVQFVRI